METFVSAQSILSSVEAHGGRSSRYGDFTVVHMHGCTFITTPMEFAQMRNWARGRVSSGNAVRDRTTFVDRFELVLAHVGAGVASRGNRMALSRIVKSMVANALMLEDWVVPPNLDEGVEIRKPVPRPAPAANDPATPSPLSK